MNKVEGIYIFIYTYIYTWTYIKYLKCARGQGAQTPDKDITLQIPELINLRVMRHYSYHGHDD